MTVQADIQAWRPSVPGIEEVFHAHFTEHRYPQHTHDTWTLLIVDSGAISYELDGHEHGSVRSMVTLLPPHVPHDGRTVTPAGFDKRVLYIAGDLLSGIGPAVDQPGLRDTGLRTSVHRLHRALAQPGEEFEAESRFALVLESLQAHLRRDQTAAANFRDRPLADRLREMIDADVKRGVTLGEAAEVLHADSTHLVRAFTREFGLPPHRYLTGRRIDLARRLLLAGQRPVEVAAATGFYDQAHLSRHFKRMIGIPPAQYAANANAPTP